MTTIFFIFFLLMFNHLVTFFMDCSIIDIMGRTILTGGIMSEMA